MVVLLVNPATFAEPAVLKLAPYNADVNVPVVPLIAPLLAKLLTCAAPAMFNVVAP